MITRITSIGFPHPVFYNDGFYSLEFEWEGNDNWVIVTGYRFEDNFQENSERKYAAKIRISKKKAFSIFRLPTREGRSVSIGSFVDMMDGLWITVK